MISSLLIVPFVGRTIKGKRPGAQNAGWAMFHCLLPRRYAALLEDAALIIIFSAFHQKAGSMRPFIRQKAGVVLVTICLFRALAAHGQPAQSASLDSAKTAYNQFHLPDSRVILNRIIGSTQSEPVEKAEALQAIATQEWKIYRDFAQAKNYLNKALSFGLERSVSNYLLGSFSLEAGRYKEAYEYSVKAINDGRSEAEKSNAALLKAEIIHNESLDQALAGTPVNPAKLEEASSLLKGLLLKQPGRPKPAELLIGISLMRKDGADLLAAWKSYYFITSENTINQVLRPSYQELKSTSQALSKNQQISENTRGKLIKALADSRFYNYASLLATAKLFTGKTNSITTNSEVDKIIQFQKFIVDIERINKDFYPKIASGLRNYEGRYDSAFTVAAKKLWISIDDKHDLKNYNQELFFAAIRSEFGAEGYIGTTVGYHSLLLGLIIHDEKKSINQYGYKADFSYVSISRLISTDFTTWYGATNVGGWGTAASMIQVRDAYLRDPFTRLAWVTDTTARRAIVNQINVSKARDLPVCTDNRYAEPTFLSPYLRLKESKILFDSLQKSGLLGTELYLAFIAESMRLNVEATVFAHEGRHAIDQLFFKAAFDSLSHDERELRAKLSEVRFASNPKLALTGSIFGSNLDETTHHGKANFRFRKLFADWMQVHVGEVGGINKRIPLLMQLDLLSNEQILAICESADPLHRLKR